MSGWNTIESDAGVFSKLASDLGAEGIQFEDVPYVDYITEELSPLLRGIIFLFPFKSELYSSKMDSPLQGSYIREYKGIFFSQQTVQNACATQAVLNCLFNLAIQNPGLISLGEELSQFYDFIKDLDDPAMIGDIIGSSDLIRTVHNSFTPPNPFEFTENIRRPRESDDVFHFVTFVPLNGRIYELDGLQPSPIDHGPYTNFPMAVTELLKDRLQKMMQMGMEKFNIIGVIRDKLAYLQEQLENDSLSESERFFISEQLQQEFSKRERWSDEMTFRKHNLTGMVLALAKQIASSMTDAEFEQQIRKKENNL